MDSSMLTPCGTDVSQWPPSANRLHVGGAEGRGSHGRVAAVVAPRNRQLTAGCSLACLRPPPSHRAPSRRQPTAKSRSGTENRLRWYGHVSCTCTCRWWDEKLASFNFPYLCWICHILIWTSAQYPHPQPSRVTCSNGPRLCGWRTMSEELFWRWELTPCNYDLAFRKNCR